MKFLCFSKKWRRRSYPSENVKLWDFCVFFRNEGDAHIQAKTLIFVIFVKKNQNLKVMLMFNQNLKNEKFVLMSKRKFSEKKTCVQKNEGDAHIHWENQQFWISSDSEKCLIFQILFFEVWCSYCSSFREKRCDTKKVQFWRKKKHIKKIEGDAHIQAKTLNFVIFVFF